MSPLRCWRVMKRLVHCRLTPLGPSLGVRPGTTSQTWRNKIGEGAFDQATRLILVGARRIGTIVPGKIVPVVVPFVMDLNEVMATNLRRERHAQNLTQEDLADRAGVSSRYLGSIERAAVSASVTVLGQLSKALQIDPCDLLRQPKRRKSGRSS
jgi:DNA-binding XRE family transcriptional regulator